MVRPCFGHTPSPGEAALAALAGVIAVLPAPAAPAPAQMRRRWGLCAKRATASSEIIHRFLRRLTGARLARARHGNKPPASGTAASAFARAFAAIGGVRAVEAATQIKAARLYEAADPDVAPGAGARKPLGYHEACAVAAAGGVALAEHLAACAGGVFQPLAVDDGRPLAELEAELIRAAGGFAAARVAGDRRGADRALDDLVALAGAVRARCGAGVVRGTK